MVRANLPELCVAKRTGNIRITQEQTGQLKFDDSFIYKKIPLSRIAEAFEMFKTPGLVKGKILIDSEK